MYIFFYGAATQRGSWPPHSWGFKITHNDASKSVGVLWTSDQLVAETSTWQHTTLTTDKYPCTRWDSNPRSQQASGRRPTRLRPRGHWDRHIYIYIYIYYQRQVYRWTQNVVIRQACVSIRYVILKGVNLQNIRRMWYQFHSLEMYMLHWCVFHFGKVKVEQAIPLQDWAGPEGSKRLRLPDSKTVGT